MARLLSNLVNNLGKEFVQLNLNMNMIIKNVRHRCSLQYTDFKDNLMKCKCICCNKNYQKKFYENLKKRFFNKYKFSNHGINKFLLLLREGTYPYEYMDDCEKFNKTSLPKKEDFYSNLNMEYITDAG